MFQQIRHLMEPSRFIIRGVQLNLTESLHRTALDKASRLFQHDKTIGRICIDLEIDQTRGPADRFVAKGRVEVNGPDLYASAHSENTYKALDLMVEALDALLRTRHGLHPTPPEAAGLEIAPGT
jgi:putative sigma-54 modulation protein